MIDKTAGRASRLAEFLAGEPRDLEWAEALVEQALLAGASAAEVYLKTSASTGILLQRGFATLSGGSERGAALRVFDDSGRFGHAFASWRHDETAQRLTRAALAALKQQEDGRGGWSPAPRPEHAFAPVPGVLDDAVVAREPEEKRRSLERVLGSFRAAGARPMAAFRDGITRVAVANSRGVKASFTRTLAMATLTIAQPGGWTLQSERVGCGLREADLREEADRLAGLAEAREEEAAEGDLLLQPPAAASLMRWLERELPRAETEERPGGGFRRVASEAVDLTDDPLLPEGVASAPFDGEGHPTRPRVAIRSGILMSESAAPEGEAVAGRMVRPSYRDLPRPGSTNLILRPGERDESALLAEIEAGFLLAALETDASADQPEQEARWRGVGWRIRHGEPGATVRRLLFRASPRALLEGIRESGNRLRFSLLRSTALGAPALLIRPGR